MKLQTKQRVIGGLVLLALVAIFLPVLFHNKQPSTQLSLSTKIPPPPPAPKAVLTLPAKQVVVKKPAQLNIATSSNIETVALNQAANAEKKNLIAKPIIPTKTVVKPKVAKPEFIAKPKTIAKSKIVKPKVIAKSKTVVKTKIRNKPKSAAKSTIASKFESSVLESRKLNLINAGLMAPKAWVLQLGNFEVRENATRLLKKLRQYHYDAYTRKITLKDGTRLTEVFIGPDIKLEKMRRAKLRLYHLLKLKGIIRRYEI